MRIWHEQLIPKLCQKHLCAMWREINGAMVIIIKNKKGYSHHPAVKEFAYAPRALYKRMYQVREEMLFRGYHPKEMPKLIFLGPLREHIQEWQNLEQQVEVLKNKKKTQPTCHCNV
jgi:uncharacterized protein (TIGR02328 family)